jgi:hypothetical protein
VLKKCWSYEEADRPTFEVLHETLVQLDPDESYL